MDNRNTNAENISESGNAAKLPVVSSAYVPEVRICTMSGEPMYKCAECGEYEYDVTTEGQCYVCFMMSRDDEAD